MLKVELQPLQLRAIHSKNTYKIHLLLAIFYVIKKQLN